MEKKDIAVTPRIEKGGAWAGQRLGTLPFGNPLRNASYRRPTMR